MSEMQHTASDDGTRIADEAYGTGPAALVVGGAFCDRRWPRDSGDGLTVADLATVRREAVAREVQDLPSVITTTRESDSPTYLFGVSSGGAPVIEAVAAGLPVSRAAALEVPYRTAAWPPARDDWARTTSRFRWRGWNGSQRRSWALQQWHGHAVAARRGEGPRRRAPGRPRRRARGRHPPRSCRGARARALSSSAAELGSPRSVPLCCRETERGHRA